MTDAIFLSAGVPDPKRGPQYARTADTVAITAAVSALVHVTLGRRMLVWGGQPAITPMIWVIADGLGIEYGGWVKLYQSKHFKDEFPEDNQRFQNVTYTDEVGHDRESSLRLMRERMFSDFNFTAAVFIGGMGGIVQEFDLLQQLQPKVTPLPVISTGGAVLDVAQRMGNVPPTSATIWITSRCFIDIWVSPSRRCVTRAQLCSRRRWLIGFGNPQSPVARRLSGVPSRDRRASPCEPSGAR